MKKFLFVASAVFAGASAFAQSTIYTGDGTLTSPRFVTMNTRDLRFSSTNNGGALLINGTNGSVSFTKSSNVASFASIAARNKECLVFSGGKLLDAAQDARMFNFYDFPTSNFDPTGPTVFLDIEDRGYKTRMNFFAIQNKGSKFTLWDKTQTENFSVYDDSNNNITVTMPKTNSYLGIGTTSFTDGTDIYNLSVNGNMRAKRVKVYTTWADYVFENTYSLPTLPEVEKYIKENGHLKDIPSAAEVEEKGIELGEMNKLLLQKIEELTLYTIELNKEVQTLKNQLNKQ